MDDLNKLDQIEAEYWELMEDYNTGEDFDHLARLMRELLQISGKLAEKAWMYEDTNK